MWTFRRQHLASIRQRTRSWRTWSCRYGHPLGSRGHLADPGITPPRLLSKREPKYDEPSRRARVEGTTILWAIIGVDGVATHIKVLAKG